MLHEIDADLRIAEATLRHWEREYPKVSRIATKARLRYDLAWADAIDAIADEVKDGKAPTIPVQNAMATKRVARQMAQARMAESSLDVAKKLIGIAETTLTSIQTRVKLEIIEKGLS